MKKLLLILPAFILLSCFGCKPPVDNKRYEMCASPFGEGRVELYIIDSYTGKSWYYIGSNNKAHPDSNWAYMGTPANMQ